MYLMTNPENMVHLYESDSGDWGSSLKSQTLQLSSNCNNQYMMQNILMQPQESTSQCSSAEGHLTSSLCQIKDVNHKMDPIPDRSRPMLTTTTIISAVDLQGANGNWTTVCQRRGGRRAHRQREERKCTRLGMRVGIFEFPMTGKAGGDAEEEGGYTVFSWDQGSKARSEQGLSHLIMVWMGREMECSGGENSVSDETEARK